VAVSEVKLPVSEVKPSPNSRSGQKSSIKDQKSYGQNSLSRGSRRAWSRKPEPRHMLFYNRLRRAHTGAWPDLEATDFKTTTTPKSGITAGSACPGGHSGFRFSQEGACVSKARRGRARGCRGGGGMAREHPGIPGASSHNVLIPVRS
jgi:hypothetical protein